MSFIEILPLFNFVAMILSSVSLALMALNHLATISSVLCELPFITRSHLRTQMRCADSETRICNSLSFPFLSLLFWELSSSSSFVFCSVTSGGVRFPQPRIVPILITGHDSGSWGQFSRARAHILLTGSVVQDVRMCSMLSVVLHLGHWPLSSYPGIFNQKLPTL